MRRKDRSGLVRSVQRENVEPAAGAALGALGGAHAVPQRGPRLLVGREFDRDVFEVEEVAVEVEPARRKPGQEHLEGFFEERLRRLRIDAVEARLDRRDATTDSD